jgi:hypothetical protein
MNAMQSRQPPLCLIQVLLVLHMFPFLLVIVKLLLLLEGQSAAIKRAVWSSRQMLIERHDTVEFLETVDASQMVVCEFDI